MPDASSMTMRAEYQGRLSDIPALGAAVEAFCRARGLQPQVAYKLILAIEELITNLAMHGAGANAESGGESPDAAAHRVTIFVSLEGARLVAIYEDGGAAFDPLSVPPPDFAQPLEDRRVGGLGVHLLRSLMDEVTYARVNGRNRVTLRLTIPATAF